MTENGEHGATAICTRAPSASACSRSVSARIVVDVLDERVRRQPAVRLAEVHRAARGDEADAELLRGADLRLDEPRDAAREHVVVVEDRRAARQRELGEAARAAAYSISSSMRAQRGYSVFSHVKRSACCARARVSVWYRWWCVLTKPGRDDRAAEILGAVGRVARADLRRRGRPRPGSSRARCSVPASSIVTSQQLPRITRPPAGRARTRSTSTRPRSVSFSDGITDRARNASSWNGASIVQPSCAAAATTACERSTTSASGASLREPGDRQRQLGEHLGAVDGDDAAADVREPPHGGRHRRVAHADDDEVVRVVGDASSRARRARARSRSRSRARSRPVPRWRSTTAIFAWSRSGRRAPRLRARAAPRRATR